VLQVSSGNESISVNQQSQYGYLLVFDRHTFRMQVADNPRPHHHAVSSTSPNPGLLAASLTSISSLLFLQLFSRVFTFILNQALVRLATPQTFGTATVQFELLLSTTLFLSREGVRIALLRQRKNVPPDLARNISPSGIRRCTDCCGPRRPVFRDQCPCRPRPAALPPQRVDLRPPRGPRASRRSTVHPRPERAARAGGGRRRVLEDPSRRS
jgi:hypothetical protein